jgi:hypothetical protein
MGRPPNNFVTSGDDDVTKMISDGMFERERDRPV